MRILYITSRFPYPPYKGDKLRAYYQIRELSKYNDITLISFIDTSDDDFQKEMKKYCRKIILVDFSRFEGIFNVLKVLFTDKPLQVGYFYSKKMQESINTELSNENYDLLYSQLIRTSDYIVDKPDKKAIDLVDSISLNYSRVIKNTKTLLKPLYYFELSRLIRYERQVCRNFDTVILISEQDRDQIGDKSIHIIKNGVDRARFNIKCSKGTDLIFIGNMNYLPNIQAVGYFLKDVFPKVVKIYPRIKCYIVGPNPPKSIIRLQNSNVIIKGFVPDLKEIYSKAGIFVAPLISGAGLQNKVLEAMSCKVPVVATSIANAGIKARNNVEVLIADEPNLFAQRIMDLLDSKIKRDKIASNAFRFIKANYDWEKIGKELNECLMFSINH